MKPAAFGKLDLSPAYRQVAAALAGRITSGALPVGERLASELSLAGQFGVNRSTIREALRELESAGLVRREKGSKLMMACRPDPGAVASGVSRALSLHEATILEVWETMMVLEPPIAGMAAQRRSRDDLAALEAVAVKAGIGSLGEGAAQAADFFRALAQAAHNGVCVMSQEPLLRLLEPSLRRLLAKVPQSRARIATAQRRIVAAVGAGSPGEASNWCEKHVRDYRRGFEVAGIDLSSVITHKG